MTVELISVGTEILMGNIVNTNAAFLSAQCVALGLSCYHQSVVGDNEGRMEEAMQTALSRSDLVLISGGLGPTRDDLTKEVAAKVMEKKLVMDMHTRDRIQAYFDRIKRSDITENNWKQAVVPEGAIVLDNDNGTAPGLILEKEGKVMILLPGPPGELIPLFQKKVRPYLEQLQEEKMYSCMVKICSVGESRAETMVADLLEGQTNPTIAPYAKTGEVHFRITAREKTQEAAELLMEPVLKEMKRRFGSRIYTVREEETLEEVVVRLLEQGRLTITTVESCTGGLLSGQLVNVPGASKVLERGFVTYSNEAKIQMVGVSPVTLEEMGAVSQETAEEMAEGGRKAAGADVGISITGVAGPGGGTEEKPVGMVCMACSIRGEIRRETFYFSGDREKIRKSSVVQGLNLIREELLKYLEGQISGESA